MDLKKVLTLHSEYLLGSARGVCADLRGADLSRASLQFANLSDANLSRANLSGADLRDANLRGADLSRASLQYANLRDADLQYANLQYANLQFANLSDANLSRANLRGADLSDANLSRANLRGADLRGADLRGADLRGADLIESKLPHFQICPQEGSFIAYKKTTHGVIRVLIPENAKRTSAIVGRKCRASEVVVLDGEGCGGTGPNYPDLSYEKGKTITADTFDADIRVECTNGIHFFMTEQEAKEWC